MRRLWEHIFAGLVLTTGAVLVGVGTGCTPVRYEYTQPATAEGRACADGCAGARQLCESRARVMDQQCRAVYRAQMTQYAMCRQGGRRPLCIAPDACTGPEYARCTLDFNDCFADCGGQVIEVEEETASAPPR